MKKGILLFFISCLPSLVSAQWNAQLGVNVIPLIAKTLEVTSEFSHHPGYSLNVNAGYTFKTGFVGIPDYKIYDYISDRQTSGAFLKAGGRLYLRSLTGVQRRTNFFVGAAIIVSQYDQTALRRLVTPNGENTENYVDVSAKGVSFCPAFSIGFSRRIGEKFTFDWGLQKALVTRENDFIGTRRRNYQPGAGSGQSVFLSYFQGILSLKYSLN
ncbi:hypothetical protein L0657_24930 [Dyadobacter sp. CY345]|uniref:hypothetical protein n=1 Tax=Dyadobacter sp. CY345 TaxID=2909335 RepID=UPI001F408753|nr:hypothetical protein [Dyadobacter sp. CY345]MCF2447223.1 hypothetical protein [Dyadobacter sp. CY345]